MTSKWAFGDEAERVVATEAPPIVGTPAWPSEGEFVNHLIYNAEVYSARGSPFCSPREVASLLVSAVGNFHLRHLPRRSYLWRWWKTFVSIIRIGRFMLGML